MAFQMQIRKTLIGEKSGPHAVIPLGRGSEGLLMGQQGRGYRSVLISIGDFRAQWRSTAA